MKLIIVRLDLIINDYIDCVFDSLNLLEIREKSSI